MSTTPYDDQLDIPPFWLVQPVFDPDGTGGDCAYTIGLSDRGLPELHLYSRPSLGADPGLDWMFSSRDSVRILNQLAAMLVRGALGVGSRLRREYDGGLSVVDFRIDPPEDPELLEAYGVPPGADVLPVRWSLTRPPEGPTVPLTASARRLAHRRYAGLLRPLDVAGLPDDGRPVRARAAHPDLPTVPCFDPGQRFGPLTPLVLARSAQFVQADPGTISDLVLSAHAVDEAAGLSWPRVRARALARPVGRVPAIDAVDVAAEEIVEEWSGGERPTDRWRRLLSVFLDEEADPLVSAPVEANLRDMMVRAIRCCLAGEVVADLADPALLLWATGPWHAACAPDNRPGPEWQAAAPVLERAREVLAGAPADLLQRIGELHLGASLRAHHLQPEAETPYARLRNRLTAWTLISAAGCPPARELLAGLPAVADLVERMARATPAQEEAWWGLNDWLECLTSLLVHRARLTAAEVHALCDPVAALLPDLEGRLNDPV